MGFLMRTIAGTWIVSLTVSLWLFFTSHVQAINAQVINAQAFHHFFSNDLHSEVVISRLSEENLSQLKESFIEDRFDFVNTLRSDCLESSGLTEIEDNYCAVIADLFDFVAWNNLGQKLFVRGRDEAALMAYDHSLLINPEYSLGLANRCGVLSRLGEYDLALISCELALKGDGRWGIRGSTLAWNNKGDVLFNLKRYQESLSSFDQALAISHNYASAQRNRAVVLHQLQKITQEQGEDNDIRFSESV
ncbi:MAG: tetratricopeptide repeat protein [Okeania sp. SIO3B3]|nr:tetratricopeptide repeat protein [Okeania sp. SIO3B3]